MRMQAGDKVRITEGMFEGVIAIFKFLNRETNNITVMVPASQVDPKDRHKFIVNRKGYIPMTLMEGEWEPVDKRVIIT